MAHPKMYEEDDPYLVELRKICLSFPETREAQSWGRPTFRAVNKIFGVYGASQHNPHSVIFKPDEEDRVALTQDKRIFVPPYWGPSGWLALDFEVSKVDWQEVAEIMDSSYRLFALKRMIKALDTNS